MPDLTEATEDIEPAVVQLRAAAKMMPTLLMGYFFSTVRCGRWTMGASRMRCWWRTGTCAWTLDRNSC